MNLLLSMFAISTSIRFGESYLHLMFLKERKVNGSPVIKKKAEKLFVIDLSIAYSKYFIQLFHEAVYKI